MKNLDIRDKADLLRQLAHPVRLLILEELFQGAKCVTDIKDVLDIPQPNVSQHLLILRRNRIIDFYEDGSLRCYYLLRPALVRGLFNFISGQYPIIHRDREEVRQEGKMREQKKEHQAAG